MKKRGSSNEKSSISSNRLIQGIKMTCKSILSSSKRIKPNRAHSLSNDNNIKSRNPYSG